MEGHYAKDKKEALDIALSIIEKGSSISWGGTMSAAEIGLTKAVIDGDYTVYNRDKASTPEEKKQAEINASTCDYFLASSNAITEDGVLINIDGFANRVAAIACGPKNVVMIIGMNKICKDVDAAMSRARNVAAPINAGRFGLETPCSKTGACEDCKSPDTVCCQILITRFSRIKDRIKVILVNDSLGF
jgi:hypothetical protein